METLRLKVRQPAEDPVENWDDGDFMMDGDDFALRNNSGASRPPSRRRDSGSSHLSLRSDLESWTGEDERQVHIPGDDEKSTSDAIFAAQSAGIPLPKNIPSSALMGGTIKRLGGKKIRKIIQEDWENDLELPDTTQGLKIKFQRHSEFPETLRQISTGSVHSSPVKLGQTSPRALGQALVPRPAMINLLDKFKDNEDDDFFGDGCETIKISKQRPAPTPKPVSLITPPTPSKSEGLLENEDDFEKDLELPSHGKLQLSTRRDIPKTPSAYSDDLDWGEGSLGTRFGGTRRDGRSNRSSSASALSPSVSSSITMESEDETFDGLVLPAGPVNFQERLQQRKKSRSPQRIPEEGPSPPKRTSTAEADKPDFLDGLDFGDGDPFNAGKLTLHKNIKVKETRPSSPARPKTAISLTFTNKPVNTRIPRLSHERAHSTTLEPVSESGGPIPPRTRRPQSRMGHSSQSSVTSIPTPTTPSPNQRFPPSTPSRRELASKVSTPSMRAEATTTSAQLLKQKRSLPAIRAMASKNYRFDSSSSRLDHRPQTGVRPKTPVEPTPRASMDSSAQPTRKKSQPFLPAGASSSQSQHVNAKSVRQLRRHDSDNALDLRPQSRAFSRSTMRSPSPQQRLRVAADTWERLSRPKTKKQFGDGHELDAFDDLPTSKETETRFLRQPVGTNGSNKPLLRRAGPSITDRMNAPSPHMSTKSLSTPRFARDTAASRIARETSLANRNSINGPLAPVNAQRAVQSSPAQAPPLSIRTTPNIQSSAVRSKKSKRPVQQKPHLISNLNAGKESKTVNGMFYNADTYRWEGNENALSAFDAGVVTPIAAPSAHVRENSTTTPRPALITNISTTKGVQVVNGMVFDPSSMCWLKLGAQQEGPKSDKSDPLENFNALDDDEDVFKDIPDLEEMAGDEEGQGRVSDINDDWLVGEEFDVGPEFIRRQREEEDRWRKKCGKWAGRGTRDPESWRWTIRELVSQFDELPM